MKTCSSGSMTKNAGTKLKTLLPWVAMGLFWAVVYGPGLFEDARFALEPEVMCDDVRIVIFHFFNWMDPTLFVNDALGQYHSDGTGELFRALFYLVAKLGDPYQFTKLAPFVLYVITLAGVGVAAQGIGGKVATFVAVTLCLGSSLMMERLSGSLPRAFAYPVLAWMAAALVHGRVRLLAGLTVLGAGLYPILAVLGGLSLSSLLFILPAADRGRALSWGLRRRFTWLLGTAVLSVLITVPFMLRMHQYGATITQDLLAQFPEAGVGGRQDSMTRPPFAPVEEAWMKVAEDTLTNRGPRFVPAVGGSLVKDSALRERWFSGLGFATILGCVGLGVMGSRGTRRLAVLALAIGVGYVLANAVTPRLVVPPRYTLYGVPIITVLTLSVAPAGLWPATWGTQSRSGTWLRFGFLCSAALLVLALFGGHRREHSGMARFVQRSDRQLFKAIARLPKGSLVAGWPEGAMETMPIISRRTPFLTRELHVPYHTDMTLRMRQRMQALVSAYYASDNKPLQQLRDEFGVTHLVVERGRLARQSHYFRPFGPLIASAFAQGRAAGFAVEALKPTASVFDGGNYYILDLARLP